MPSEELVETIFRRVLDTTGDTVVTACLFRLADRGVFTLRELPEVARQLKQRQGDDLRSLSDVVVNEFALAAKLPATPRTIEGGR